MQSVSSRIWTRVAVSISYDDNHYTTSTSVNYRYVCLSRWDVVICFYLYNPENFVRLILQDGFWFVHKPFGGC